MRSRPRGAGFWLAGLVLLSALTAFFLWPERAPEATSAEAGRNLNVVLITVDTLRADHLGCYGGKAVRTPHIDALAADGMRFQTVVSEVPLTLPAHSSLLTGLYPVSTGVHDNLGYVLSPKHLTLAEILQQNGYSTGAFVGAYVLDSKWGLDQGFDRYDDDLHGSSVGASPESVTGRPKNSAVERRAEDVRRPALEWIGAQGQKPFFCWIHFFDPHDPYEPPEPYRSQYQDPYAGEVAYTDQIVGEVLDFLRVNGLYDRSLVLLAGDHGEGLGEHGEMTHGYFLYDATLLVPWILRVPPSVDYYAREPRVVRGIVQLVDILPTILQILRVDIPETVQGRGQLAALMEKSAVSDRAAFSETYYPNEFGWSELRSWRTLQHKYILGPKPELYDLSSDPGEGTNLLDRQASLANQFREQIQAFETRYRDGETAEEARTAVSGEDLERFRSLGYIGAPTAGRSERELSLPDPKDKIETYSLISQAMTLIARGQEGRALPLLQQLLRQDASILSAHSMLGQCYLQMGRYRDAIGPLEHVLQEDPSRLHPRLHLGEAYFQLKDYTRAKPVLEELIKLDPGFFQAYHYLGLIYTDQGLTDQAVEAFSKAVEIRDDAVAFQMLGYLYTKTRQPDRAAQALSQAVRIDPNNALAHLYLANAYHLLGETSRAREEFEKAVSLDPGLRDKVR